MVGQPAQDTESKIAAGANAQGAAGLLHDGQLAARAGAVHHICHQVQGGLEEKAVVACKQVCIHQLLDLEGNTWYESDSFPGTPVLGGALKAA